MTKITNMTKVFLTKIQALYDTETQLEKALPKMEKAAINPDLKDGFASHHEETKTHIKRLEQIFKSFNETPKKTKSEGIRGILEDGKWIIDVEGPNFIKDTMLASAARYAEHYEMAGYMSAIIEANGLGLFDAAELLTLTLNEEKAADKKLEDSMSENLSDMNE